MLDPIVSLRRRVRVRPGQTVRVAFSTLVAPTRSAVLDLAATYHDVTTFERVATSARAQAKVQLHHLGIGPDEADLFQALGGAGAVGQEEGARRRGLGYHSIVCSFVESHY